MGDPSSPKVTAGESLVLGPLLSVSLLKVISLFLCLSVVDAAEFSTRVIVGPDEAHESREISLIVKLEAEAIFSLLGCENDVYAPTEVLSAYWPVFKS